MTPDEKLDAVRAELVKLRVSQAVIRTQLRNLTEDLAAELATRHGQDKRIGALERWRWKLGGALAVLLIVGEPVWALIVVHR